MSTTRSSVTTLEQPPKKSSSVNGLLSPACQSCGAEIPHSPVHEDQDAQKKIEELEAQVKLLTVKATAAGKLLNLGRSKSKATLLSHLSYHLSHFKITASNICNSAAMHHMQKLTQTRMPVERATDYEDALRQFASATNSPLPAILTNGNPSTPRNSEFPPLPNTAQTSNAPVNTPLNPPNSRLSRLLPSRRPSGNSAPSTAPLHQLPAPYASGHPSQTQYTYPQTASLYGPASAHTPNTAVETELLTALTREQNLRLAAENQVSRTNDEIEELTGQLFQQANEMVAAERKARARLEDRVVVLERRDGEKAKRLEVLESRLGRIERVRELLRVERPDFGRGNGSRSEDVKTEMKDGAAAKEVVEADRVAETGKKKADPSENDR